MPKEIETVMKPVKSEVVRKGSRYLMGYELEEVVDQLDADVNIIGSGAECVVFDSPKTIGGKEIVISVDYHNRTPLNAKKVFYTMRILSTLFPHNFPHFYATGTDKNMSSFAREKIKNEFEQLPLVKYPFSDASKLIEDLGLPVMFDDFFLNYAVGVDGGEYYLDTPLGFLETWPKEETLKYMEKKGFTETQRRIVSKSMDRLEKLGRRIR